MGTVRKSALVLLGILLAVAGPVLWLPATAEENQGRNGTTLTADVGVSGHWTTTYGWTIAKSATPASWDLFRGDSGTSLYTISVTKDTGNENVWFEGAVEVFNGGAVATDRLAIAVEVSLPPDKTVLAEAAVDTSAGTSLAPYTGHSYPYRIAIPAGSVTPGATYKVTANVTILNHSGSLDSPSGPSPSNTSGLPAVATLVNDSVHVSDTDGQSWQFAATASQSYAKTFTGADAGVHNNTATIQETNQSASAAVAVNVYDLAVVTSSRTSFTRNYSWSIQKTGDQASLTLAAGQQYPVNYSVSLNATHADSDWLASGNIAITNPAPIPATIDSLSDLLSPAIAAVVDCGITRFPATIPPGETLTCAYSVPLPDASRRTNVATVNLQNHGYDSQGNAASTGSTSFTGSSAADFAAASVAEIDRCAAVSDSLQGSLGNACYGTDSLPKTFAYTRNLGPYTAPGSYSLANVAAYTTNTTAATASSTWVVAISIPGGGCTLTIGYWKTHAGFGPQADMVTGRLPVWLGTATAAKSLLVNTAAQAVQVLDMNVYGTPSNGITKLYAQLLAAKLNIATGASRSAVATTIASADAFLGSKNWRDWGNLSKAQRNNVLSWAASLDKFNNGLTGPGHCSS